MNSLRGFFSLLKFLWSNRDQLLPLLQGLVTRLHAAGEGIEAAGQGSIAVSRAIKGGRGVPLNARQVTLDAAAAIDQCNELIQSAASVIDTAGREIDKVKVPAVTPTYGEVLGLRVVTGMSFGEESLFGPVADALEEGADSLEDVSTNLHNAADQLRDLGQVFNDTGTALYALGEDLIQGGRALRGVTDTGGSA